MNLRSLALAALLAAAPCVEAAEGPEPGLRTKSLSAAAAPGASAPFLHLREPLPPSSLRLEPGREALRSGCDQAARDVCYDWSDRRIVYKPARAYMPRIEGMTPESVSVRQDRVTLRYSFR